MRIFVDLRDHDQQMMRVLSALQLEKGCSPKKWQVVARFKTQHHHPNAEAENTFRKLALLEVVEHSRNGHCWLTDKGIRALLETDGHTDTTGSTRSTRPSAP